MTKKNCVSYHADCIGAMLTTPMPIGPHTEIDNAALWSLVEGYANCSEAIATDT